MTHPNQGISICWSTPSIPLFILFTSTCFQRSLPGCSIDRQQSVPSETRASRRWRASYCRAHFVLLLLLVADPILRAVVGIAWLAVPPGKTSSLIGNCASWGSTPAFRRTLADVPYFPGSCNGGLEAGMVVSARWTAINEAQRSWHIASAMKEHGPEFVEVYRTSRQQDVALVRSLLDPEGIAYYIENETAHRIDPFPAPYGLEMRVMVDGKRAEDVRSLLREFFK